MPDERRTDPAPPPDPGPSPGGGNGRGSERPGRGGGNAEPTPRWMMWLWGAIGLLLVASFIASAVTADDAGGGRLTYGEFLDRLDSAQLAEVTISDTGGLTGKLEDGSSFTSQLPNAVPDEDLIARLRAADVEVDATGPASGLGAMLFSFLPVLLLVGVMVWFARRARSGGGAASFGGFAKSKAKVIDEERPKTTFADVAGYEGAKAELVEVVDYLRRPERYHAAGAVGPGGVLMVGPPGTGKTLIARAIAGEADVAFFSVTASSFVELFVGVGAARVRDLFEQARKRVPAIIFIDEIDAIGQRRGGRSMMGNDEREQTLDQLLAEMDGFDPAEGLVVLAATNRPDVLDPALLRPGRFDRQVVIPLPNQAERLAILGVHCRSKQLGPDIDLALVARATPGFSGADLANLANEAAIVAVRDDRTVLVAADFDAARDRIVLGRRDKGAMLLDDERRIVAVHEAGHALVAALSEHADPVEKVSILPTGAALGVTHQLPVDERHIYTRSWFDDALAVRVAGRAAEQIVFKEGSSGAADDLAAATDLAIRMIRDFGMSEELGPVSYGGRNMNWTDDGAGNARAPMSEATQRVIDELVAREVRQAAQRAEQLLVAHRTQLEALAALLEEREVVDGAMIDALIAGTPL